MVKRKAEGGSPPHSPLKKGKPSGKAPADYQPFFREGLFDKAVEELYRAEYGSSSPYKHAVIHGLMDDSLLRSVRQEILKNLHFTPKETDIYRIHQSGDLANLDGLPRSALKLLPSLRQLRDSLYSNLFRDFLCQITGCGPLSGRKTDMAINVYTPGSHLLAHDDVIGSRRVSYILYLTSPDDPWQPSWGGALRLYPTKVAEDGVTRVPEPQWSKVIPPAWNQLSFFEVQPGRSFHDVEEVYAEEEGEEQRARVAISGWFHIPQEGEEGYIEGLEEELAKESSLQQLQSKSDAFDLPKRLRVHMDDGSEGGGDEEEIGGDGSSPLTEKDLDFLLKYIAPTYLTPDTLESMAEAFAEDSSVQIAHFLSKPFSKKLKDYIRARDGKEYLLDESEGWEVAVPPHKHRYLYLQKPPTKKEDDVEALNPIEQLLTVLLPSKPFSKLLQLATGLKITLGNLLARRFRRGLDYTLASGSGADLGDDEGQESGEDEEVAGADLKVEICLGITPSKGWGGEDEEDEDEEHGKNGKSKGKGKAKIPKITQFDDSEKSVGGYEMYMAGDSDSDSDDSEDPNQAFKSNGKKKKSDPAIYKSGRGSEDDTILFTMPAGWNRLGIVLRDAGVLRFVKYVSKSAAGDRWDVVGEWGLGDDEEEVGGGGGGDGEGWAVARSSDDESEGDGDEEIEEGEGEGDGEDGEEGGDDNGEGEESGVLE